MDGVILDGLLFGLGLSVDAFLIALSNGLNFPNIKMRKLLLLAALFSSFQIIMPMFGWLCVHTVSVHIPYFDEALSWIAFVIIMWLGAKMMLDGLKPITPLEHNNCAINLGAVILQCFATSVDSLAVGFTLTGYAVYSALVCSCIIAAVTFALFCLGFFVGKKCGMMFSSFASIVGGIVFIGVGVEVIATSIF